MRTSGAWVIRLNCILFPVPDGPVMRVGRVLFDNRLMIEEYLIVSIVYTIISWKLCSFE